jgi:hypothetical protein
MVIAGGFVVIVWWIVVRRWRLFERGKFFTFSNFIFGWTSSIEAFRLGTTWVGHPARTKFFP